MEGKVRFRFVVLVVGSMLAGPTPPGAAQEQGRDARMTVEVDSILRSDIHPEGFLPLSSQAPPLEAGHYYCVIFTTFTRIHDAYLQGLGGRDAEKSLLRDSGGGTHSLRSYQVGGLEFLDFSDIRSPSWIPEGGTANLFFQLPEGTDPEALILRYYFKDALEDEAARIGEVEIQLRGGGGLPNPDG